MTSAAESSAPVAAADGVGNEGVAQVTGNKEDVANETVDVASLVGLARAALARLVTLAGLHVVPAQDSADDVNLRDVIGKKSDTIAGTSLISMCRMCGIMTALPAADSILNTTIGSSIGNKEDVANETVDESSLIGLARAIIARLVVIDAFHDVPAQDSADNAVMSDVIGTKLDGHDANSIRGIVHTIEEDAHAMGWILPDLGASILVTAAGGAWTYGAASATLGTPGDDFDIHWLDIVANHNDQYQLQLLVDGTPVWEGGFERTGAQAKSFPLPVKMAIAAAASITVKIASAGGGSTANVKAMGHNY